MARHYHNQSQNYSKKQFINATLRGYLILITSLLFLAIMIYLAAVITNRVGGFANCWPSYIFVFIIYLLLLFLFEQKFYYSAFSNQDSNSLWQRGVEGEKLVARYLEHNLPSDYSFFCNLKILGQPEDIDVVIVGPKGIFLLEIKNYYNARVDAHGRSLVFDASYVDHNILHKVERRAHNLSRLLNKKLHQVPAVVPVLVFANKVDLKFGFNKVKGVHVVQLEHLERLIQKHSEQSLSMSTIDRLEKFFINLVNHY